MLLRIKRGEYTFGRIIILRLVFVGMVCWQMSSRLVVGFQRCSRSLMHSSGKTVNVNSPILIQMCGVRSSAPRFPASRSRTKLHLVRRMVKEDDASEEVEKRKKESKNENFIILQEENDLSDEKIASLIARMSKSNRRQEDGNTIYSKAALLRKEEEEEVGSSGILPGHDPSEVPLAQVTIKNSQKLFPIDLERVREDLDILRTILNVRDFSVDVLFCTDAKICRLNRDYRDKLKPTDVLSFPITEFAPPEVLAETLHCPEERLLGDIVISPAYVYRQCLQDMQRAGQEIADTELNSKMLQILEKESASPPAEPTEKDGDASHVQDSIDGANDRGVSRAMASLYSFEDRLPLLLIHGLLHLLGHDHETSEDWLRMTQREVDVLQRYREYRQRSGAGAGNT